MKIAYIELPVADVAASKRFYTSVFGWTFKDWGDDYSDTSDGGLTSGLNGDREQNTKHPLVAMQSDDLENTFASVKKAGGTITREIFSYPGGRRFHFKDPAGNELAVFEVSDGS